MLSPGSIISFLPRVPLTLPDNSSSPETPSTFFFFPGREEAAAASALTAFLLGCVEQLSALSLFGTVPTYQVRVST